MPKSAKLIIAASETDPNLYYACRFLVPDPVIYFEIGGKKNLILSDLEIDRARLQARVHALHSLSDLAKTITVKKRKSPISPYALIVDSVFRKKGVKEILVPANFPAAYYEALAGLGYRIIVKPDPFFESRLVKTNEEKQNIHHTLIQMEKVLAEIIRLLQKSKIKRRRIYSGRQLVTSEFLKELIDFKLMERGCIASNTIVASGVQGSLPHHEGSGPILPHTPIIFDIFPRSRKTRYWGDMTRTVVKGKPTAEVKKMYAAVKEANKLATEKVRAGIHSTLVHKTAAQCLERHGFKTGKMGGRMQGFIHSTGHGLGLEIHEPPSVSLRGSVLQKGNVITIEPGLYYEKHGGIRIEDSLYVTKTGSEVLTTFPKFLEIDR